MARNRKNIAARMGRWSAAHRKAATLGWLAFVIVAFGLGSAVGTKQVDQTAPGPGESGRMQKILDDGFKQPVAENILIQSRSLRVGDAAFNVVIHDVIARVSTMANVQKVRRGPVSKDRHSALVEFDIPGATDKAPDKVGAILDGVAGVQRTHPGFFIGEFGLASAMKGTDTAFGNDLAKAGQLSLPVTLIILVLAFGALVAAGIPLLLGLTAVFATFGLMALPSHLVPVAIQAYAMVLLIGLAVGVDYSMFYLKRERQERAAGRGKEAALAAAAATSGRSVLISGITVMTAMAGMFMTGDETFSSLAFATILVVAVAVLGSLTVLPAVLSKLGDKVDRLRVPLVGRRRRDSREGGVWGAIVDRVLRRPALCAALAAGVLLALAAPALQLKLAPQGTESFPQSLQVVKNYKRMQAAFPGKALPANVVVKAPDVTAPAVRAAIARLERRAVASGRAFRPITVDVNKDRTVADVTIPIAGNGTDAASNAAFRLLRKTIVPETLGALPQTEAGVTGQTASWQDSAAKLKSDLPPVVGFVLLLAFALMLVAFRSVVIAVKAIVLNLLSVAAAYGVLVLVFQHGIGNNLVGADSANGIEVVVPLLLFVILFGLSMDYHVFIISRIRETFDRGASVDDAVAHGIKSTAGVVTSAAIVMVCVFSIFATLSTPFFKQFGVGLAAAILIDATIVRAVLLPASMKLLGKWNWYLPRWLEWLPRLEHYEPEFEPEPEAEPESPADAKRPRVLTPGRITGLVLIGLVVGGLGYLHSGSAAVSVPSGAKAGDLTLKPCSYQTEKGAYKADCGTLVVRENRADPRSRLIALPVKRIRARSAHPAEPIFRLMGGPGVTNMAFAKASRFAGNHDVVMVGYRGVDGSVKLDCPEVESAVAHSTDILAAKTFRAESAAFKKCATRLRDDGVDLAGYGLPQQADDIEAGRVALGYKHIDLLSESAGTRLALIYTWRYPRSVHRSVMIGVNPPGHFLWNAKTTDEQVRRYSALCAKDSACSRRTGDLAASLRRTAADVPGHWLFLPIKKGNVRLASFFGLMETTSTRVPLSASTTLSSWLSADEGDASGFWFQSLLADLFYPKAFVWGEYAAVARADAAAAKAYYASGRAGRTSTLGKGHPGTDFLWLGGRLVDSWPATPGENQYARARRSNVETLMIGGALDFATPPQDATRELLPYLPRGRQVVLPGFGHTDSFWSDQAQAGTRLINAYLANGRIDTSLYRPQKVDFAPEVSEASLGKGFGGAMAGFGLLTVLSLLWLPGRVHRRGRFGRKSGALLRSIYPIVLGVGGWFTAVLIVVTATPTVPLADPTLAAGSIGGPVGLCVYFAWTNRGRSATTKLVGLVAAVGGALVGARLGFDVTPDLTRLFAAAAGSVAGANLLLLVLDMGVDLRARARLAPKAQETLAPHPSTG
jgi:RND superfamily putative drug exporter